MLPASLSLIPPTRVLRPAAKTSPRTSTATPASATPVASPPIERIPGYRSRGGLAPPRSWPSLSPSGRARRKRPRTTGWPRPRSFAGPRLELRLEPGRVPQHPAAHDPAAVEVEDRNAGVADAAPGRRDSEQRSSMGALVRQSRRQRVAFRDHLLDGVAEVGKRRAHRLHVAGEAGSAPDLGAERAPEGDVGVDQRVGEREVPLVPELLVVAPHQLLRIEVRVDRHSVPLRVPPPSRRNGGSSARTRPARARSAGATPRPPTRPPRGRRLRTARSPRSGCRPGRRSRRPSSRALRFHAALSRSRSRPPGARTARWARRARR